jgi:hypothetical protein
MRGKYEPLTLVAKDGDVQTSAVSISSGCRQTEFFGHIKIIMKHILTPAFISVLFLGCGNSQSDKNVKSDTAHIYPTVSYLDIKLDAGRLPSNPYILEFTNGRKKIVFCGTNHLTDISDTGNSMFTKIEEKCFSFRPDVCLNEGGDISQKKYASRKDALLKDGEIGLTKILADSLKVKCINGDMTEEFEFRELLKKYSTEEFIAYVVNERLMWGLVGHNISRQEDVEKEYKNFIKKYIMELGKVKLTETQQSFNFFKSGFEKTLGRPFDINRPEPTNPFEPTSKFQQIGRTSKEIRDQNLMKTIDRLLDTNDKIFVVFGGWHLLTCKPGLEEIINRKRE